MKLPTLKQKLKQLVKDEKTSNRTYGITISYGFNNGYIEVECENIKYMIRSLSKKLLNARVETFIGVVNSETHLLMTFIVVDDKALTALEGQ